MVVELNLFVTTGELATRTFDWIPQYGLSPHYWYSWN
jgi:hypothetical protein